MQYRKSLVAAFSGVAFAALAGCAISGPQNGGASIAEQGGPAGSSIPEVSIPLFAQLATDDDGEARFSRFTTGRPGLKGEGQEWVNFSDKGAIGKKAYQATRGIHEFDARLRNLDQAYRDANKAVEQLETLYHRAPIPEITFNIVVSDDIDGEKLRKTLDERPEDVLPAASIAYHDLPRPFEQQTSNESSGYDSFAELEVGVLKRVNSSMRVATRMSESVSFKCTDAENSSFDIEYTCPSNISLDQELVTVDLVITQ